MTARTFLVLFLVFVTSQSDGQMIIKHQTEVLVDKTWKIEDFANGFIQEVRDSLMSKRSFFSIEHLGITILGCTDSSFTLEYEAKLYEAHRMDADYGIRRAGSVAISKNPVRAQNKALRHAHKKGDDLKRRTLQTYHKSTVGAVVTGDRKDLCVRKKSVCVVEKFIVIKKTTQVL